MQKIIYLFVFISLISNKGSSQCAPATADIFTFNYNQAKYEVVKIALSWEDAAACAAQRGGKLAEIENAAEQDSLYFRIGQAGITAANTVAPDGGGASYLWIGANDIANEGTWIWDGVKAGSGVQFWQGDKTGSAVGGRYNNWGNEPDNFGVGQDGLGLAITNWPMGVAGQWNDVNEDNLLYFLIEYSPDTITGSLETEQHPNFAVYPNPIMHKKLHIKWIDNYAGEEIVVRLTHLTGKEICKIQAYRNEPTITLPSYLMDGLYILEITSDKSEQLYRQKVLIYEALAK